MTNEDFRITFSADNTPLKLAIKEVSKSFETLDGVIKVTTNKLTSNFKNVENEWKKVGINIQQSTKNLFNLDPMIRQMSNFDMGIISKPFKNVLPDLNKFNYEIVSMGKELDPMIRQMAGFGDAVSDVQKNIKTYNDVIKKSTKNTKNLKNSNKELDKSMGDIKWGTLGLMFFFSSLTKMTQELFNATENFFGIDLKLANFIDNELAESLIGFDANMNELGMNIESAATPTIIDLTTKLGELAGGFNDLSPASKEAISKIAGWSLVLSPFMEDIASTGLALFSFGMVGSGALGMVGAAIGKTAFEVGVWMAAIITIILLAQGMIQIFSNVAIEDLGIVGRAWILLIGMVITALTLLINFLVIGVLGVLKFTVDVVRAFVDMDLKIKDTMAGLMEFLAGLPLIGGLFGGSAVAARASADIAQGISDAMKGASEAISKEMNLGVNAATQAVLDFDSGLKALSVSMDTEKNYGVSGESEVDRIQGILNNAGSETNKAGDTYIFTMQSDLDRLLDIAGETG